MKVLRTPDERFRDLDGYPFSPHWVEVDAGDGTGGLRVHVVDEGPREAAETVVCLHGEPTWSYLYRKMIPVLAGAGHRVVAPDLVGFGRSDKPAAQDDHTYARHVEWVRAVLFDALDLTGATLVCQDWGGLIGLRLVAEHPDRFARVVAANTFLPTGDRPPGDAFLAWRRFSQEVPELPVGRIVAAGCRRPLDDAVVAAYDAPFPTEAHKAGPRRFPMLVPASPDDPAAAANRAAWELLRRWERPFVTAFSDGDPITAGADRVLRSEIPGAAAVRHRTITGAGHFLQEDCGAELAQVVLEVIAETSDVP